MKEMENIGAQLQEVPATAITRVAERNGDDLIDPARPLRHDDDAIAHVNGFIDVVRDQKRGGAARLQEPEDFILHSHAGEGIERAERFVEKEHFGIVDERTCEGDALRHSAGKMMRIGSGEGFKSHQAHEFVNFAALLAEQSARNQCRFNISAHGQPRKQTRILENESALSAWAGNWLRAHEQLARIGQIESRNQAKQSGFAAAAWPDE